MRKGRKFTALVMASVLIALGMAAGIVGALTNTDMPWLAGLLPILASAYPAYLGANALQKTAQIKAAKGTDDEIKNL